MPNQIDPDLARILPLLPLRDAASLTPSRARHDLVALADSRKDVPLPQPAAVADLEMASAAGAIPARIYRPARMPTASLVYFHGGGWVAGDLYTHDRLARTLAIELARPRPPQTPPGGVPAPRSRRCSSARVVRPCRDDIVTPSPIFLVSRNQDAAFAFPGGSQRGVQTCWFIFSAMKAAAIALPIQPTSPAETFR